MKRVNQWLGDLYGWILTRPIVWRLSKNIRKESFLLSEGNITSRYKRCSFGIFVSPLAAFRYFTFIIVLAFGSSFLVVWNLDLMNCNILENISLYSCLLSISLELFLQTTLHWWISGIRWSPQKGSWQYLQLYGRISFFLHPSIVHPWKVTLFSSLGQPRSIWRPITTLASSFDFTNKIWLQSGHVGAVFYQKISTPKCKIRVHKTYIYSNSTKMTLISTMV